MRNRMLAAASLVLCAAGLLMLAGAASADAEEYNPLVADYTTSPSRASGREIREAGLKAVVTVA